MNVSRNVITGAFLIGAVLLFAGGIFLIGARRQWFSNRLELYAEFQQVGGLQNGALVRVGGLQAGEVAEIQVPSNPEAKFRIRFLVAQRMEPLLRRDSVASIQTDGLVGNQYLQISGGTSDAPRVTDGTTIQSQEPFGFQELFTEARDIMRKANESVDEIRGEIAGVLDTVGGAASSADQLIQDVSGDVEGLMASSRQISDNISELSRGVRAGEGTVGRLFRDDSLYRNVGTITEEGARTFTNIRKSSEHVERTLADFQSSGIIDDAEQVVANTRDVTQRASDAFRDFQPDSEEGMVAELRQTLAHANEAMSNAAENTEALKRNWFFRGFFEDRRFYDLNAISVNGYKSGAELPGWPVHREWLDAPALFRPTPVGPEELTDEGKRALNQAMAGFLQYSKTDPIVVEGYAAEGGPAENFQLSHARAQLVRDYLIREFYLRPNYVGLIEMGAAETEEPDQYYEGVSLVLYTKDRPSQ